MSIYVVKLVEWYPPGDIHHGIVKFLVSNGFADAGTGCLNCKKKHMHWQDAYGHHSLPFGYGDIFCREKCYNNYRKKR